MPKRIVLCLDGTSNKYAAANTNVVKLYAVLDRTRPDQLSYYQPGIGTIPPPGVWGKFKQWFITRLDLAIALLLSNHVSDAYRFLMRYYQDGDEIFIFGFSRGAYTARVLAGMLHKVGLLTQGNEELIPFAWDMYKRDPNDPEQIAEGFKKTFSRPVRIHFLGLWDTVSSVGWALWPKHYQYTEKNPSVDMVRHAVALDERRAYFVQNSLGHGSDKPRAGLVSRGTLRCRWRLSGNLLRPFRDNAEVDGRQGRGRGPNLRPRDESGGDAGAEHAKICRRECGSRKK